MSIEAIRERLAVESGELQHTDPECRYCRGAGSWTSWHNGIKFRCRGNSGSALTFTTSEMREVLEALDRSETALANLLVVQGDQERNRSTSETP